MKISIKSLLIVVLLIVGNIVNGEERRLTRSDFVNRLEGGWLGQIIGVCWGAPTEFQYVSTIMPEAKVPKWHSDMINQAFGQDDLYVEMTFLRTLEQYGCDVSIRQAGKDFGRSRYELWAANKAGRDNLRAGIAPPDSSHPKFNSRSNDIDYQIEADYAGLISPGMPQSVVELGEKFGRLMNYGDGVYGGQFVGGMLAEAFFTDDIEAIVKAGLACIPEESTYANMVRDMLAWHKEEPEDWQSTWQKAVAKYYDDRAFLHQTNGKIDVRINGAIVLLGLLYGNKDMERTCVISMRGGFDSDCNPSSACGVLGVMHGRTGLDERFINRLNRTEKFNYTEYDFNALVAVCESLFRQLLVRHGGRIEYNEQGEEVFVIPQCSPKPSEYCPSWQPGPIDDSRYTAEEQAMIVEDLHPACVAHVKNKDDSTARVQAVVDVLFPGWKTSQNAVGSDMTGYMGEWCGMKNVLLTYPLDENTGVFLTRTMTVDAAKPVLAVVVTSGANGENFEFIARVNGTEVLRKTIQHIPEKNLFWETVRIDLSQFAGQTIEVSLENHPINWASATAYWASINMTE